MRHNFWAWLISLYRKKLAGIASQRAIADMLGVDESTVRADLGKRIAGNPAQTIAKPAEIGEEDPTNAGNPAPAWFQDDVDPARLAVRHMAQQRSQLSQKTARKPNLLRHMAHPHGSRAT